MSERPFARVYSADGTPVKLLDNPYGPIWALAFSGDGDALYMGGLDDQVHYWQFRPGRNFEAARGTSGSRATFASVHDPASDTISANELKLPKFIDTEVLAAAPEIRHGPVSPQTCGVQHLRLTKETGNVRSVPFLPAHRRWLTVCYRENR